MNRWYDMSLRKSFLTKTVFYCLSDVTLTVVYLVGFWSKYCNYFYLSRIWDTGLQDRFTDHFDEWRIFTKDLI